MTRLATLAAVLVLGCGSGAKQTPAPAAPAPATAAPVESKPVERQPVAPAPEPATASPSGTPVPPGLPAACVEYKTVLENFAKCPKLPQATRDALLESLAQTMAAWADVPAESKDALGSACQSAAEAIKESAAACN